MNRPLFPVGARLLAFARELQRAATFVEVLETARAEVKDALGFEHAWLCVADEEQAREVRVLGYSGSRQDLVWEFAPRIPGFAAFVDRAFTRAIAGRTLATFGALAEALEAIESGTSDPTNRSP